MATRVTYSAYSNHPRIFFRDTDAAMLNARRLQTAPPWGYAFWWDPFLIPYLKKNYDQTTYWTADFDLKMIGYATAAYLLNNTGFDYAGQAIGHARYVAAHPTAVSQNTARELVIGLTAVYDILHSYTSASDKAAIGQAILDLVDDMDIPDGVNNHASELMDGHTRNDQAVTAIAMIALLGESGSGYNFISGATTRLDRALDFWYGGNTGVTINGYAAMDTDRHYSQNGGSGKGPWYEFYPMWAIFQMFWAMDKGFSSCTLSGDPYNPWTGESWVAKLPLFFLHLGIRGDGEYFQLGDTYRSDGPIFKKEQRVTAAALAAHSDYRKQMHWYWDQWQAQSMSASPPQGKDILRSLCFLMIDKGDPNTAATAPINASPPIPNLQVFSPPGDIVYQSTWDKPNGCIVHLRFPEYYYRGHIDLDVGAIQISVKDDMVVLNTGLYYTSDANALFGGSHNNGWKHQSISKSGVVLCDDGSATPHGNYRASDGAFTLYPSGEGGQYWKTYLGDRDPDNVINMRTDGAGLGWKRVEGRTSDVGVEQISPPGSTPYFFYANCRRAYHKESSEFNTSAERFRICEHKIMIITDQGQWPVILRVIKTQSRLASMKKQEQWHSYGNPVMANFDINGKIELLGYRATESAGVGGKCVVWYYNFGALNWQQIGDGTKTSFGPHQFFYNPNDGSGGTNYPPANFLNTNRHLPDIGRYRVKLTPKVQQTDDFFVCALFPMGLGDVEPAITWIETVDTYGLRFPDGKVYQIFKNQVGYIAPSGAVDTTPPAAPTGLSGSSPASGTVQLLWTAVPGDPSMDLGGRYRVYRRIKV